MRGLTSTTLADAVGRLERVQQAHALRARAPQHHAAPGGDVAVDAPPPVCGRARRSPRRTRRRARGRARRRRRTASGARWRPAGPRSTDTGRRTRCRSSTTSKPPSSNSARSDGRGEGRVVGVDHVPDHAVGELVLAVGDLEVDRRAAARVQRAPQRADELQRALDVLEHVPAADEVGRRAADRLLRVELAVDGHAAVGVRAHVGSGRSRCPRCRRRRRAGAGSPPGRSRSRRRGLPRSVVALDEPLGERRDVLDERRRVVERGLVGRVVGDELGVVGGVPDEAAARRRTPARGHRGTRCARRRASGAACSRAPGRPGSRRTARRRGANRPGIAAPRRLPLRSSLGGLEDQRARRWRSRRRSARSRRPGSWLASVARRKSRSDVPVHSQSTFGALRPASRSRRFTVRKSML